ncbi:coproporphyrinogen III oxidase [uncultured Finegoldia sp.]|uniref:coproporphyrinogen III oxidase n=1 Tax=uncultured Finegoldia sp. TaxID=328009 RepID=UPI0026295638|nr:coproporphyrinogen III oxidase [uncultured Finegoldia sp.]
MNIQLECKKYQKECIDIFTIFDAKQNLKFKESEFVVGENFVRKDKTYKFKTRLELKKILYRIFQKEYNYTNEWGILTGTKPSKILRNHTDEELKQMYLISDDNLKLLRNIDNLQSKFHYDDKNYNIYINIPFCPTRCEYCSFPTIVFNNNDRRREYLGFLMREIEQTSNHLDKKKIKTIYVGGGTPTSLDEKMLEDLLKLIEEKFISENLLEYTFEAGREDSLNRTKLDLLKKHKVSRISLNPQTFNEKALEEMGRKQNNHNLIELVEQSKTIGLTVNMDFILGLVDDDVNDTIENLKILETLMPDNITFHTLSIKNGSKYSQKYNKNNFEKNTVKEQMNLVKKWMQKNGYKAYYIYRQKNILNNMENIGFCKDNPSRYNIVINEELESILGFGMTANSKIIKNDIIKYTNYKNIRDYEEKLDEIIKRKVEIISG